jgi:uncharacterized protein (TIGR02145 family)
VVDVDGNSYDVIQIGGQCWMAENLRTTHYRNGAPIPNVTSHTSWIALTSGAWCSYSNSGANQTTYGNLYNWHAAMDSRGVCPQGWHLPTDPEWTVLTSHLGGETVAGAKLRSTSSLWQPSSFSTATNSSGFSALPSGGHAYSGFGGIGTSTMFWSATSVDAQFANALSLDYEYDATELMARLKFEGDCIRCLMD